jgi:two-component system phosphate regulon sensor histidine kinase PhoR
MDRKTIQRIIVLAAVLVGGIMVSQFIFLLRAFEFQEKVASQNIKTALKRVRREVLHDFTDSSASAVQQLSPAYFAVNLNRPIVPDTLKVLLKKEFSRMGIETEFQFAIYDTLSKKMIFGDYITPGALDKKAKPVSGLIKYDYDNYYFCVYFPLKTKDIISQMSLWIFFTLLLLAALLFFTYTAYVLLKQKRLGEMQKDFINNMTHEFQTPIATICLSSEALKNPEMFGTKEKIIHYASIIQEEALRLKKQVESVLQVARTEQQKTFLNKEMIEAHDHIKMAIEKLPVSYHDRMPNLICQFTSDSSRLYVDPLHFLNIVYNLVDNAFKYSPDFSLITIHTYSKEHYFIISVSDLGRGIKKKELKKIFQKFYRIRDKEFENSKGFGIGLYYVLGMVKAHGGKIQVESEFGKGSTFSIYFPINHTL